MILFGLIFLAQIVSFLGEKCDSSYDSVKSIFNPLSDCYRLALRSLEPVLELADCSLPNARWDYHFEVK